MVISGFVEPGEGGFGVFSFKPQPFLCPSARAPSQSMRIPRRLETHGARRTYPVGLIRGWSL